MLIPIHCSEENSNGDNFFLMLELHHRLTFIIQHYIITIPPKILKMPWSLKNIRMVCVFTISSPGEDSYFPTL